MNCWVFTTKMSSCRKFDQDKIDNETSAQNPKRTSTLRGSKKRTLTLSICIVIVTAVLRSLDTEMFSIASRNLSDKEMALRLKTKCSYWLMFDVKAMWNWCRAFHSLTVSHFSDAVTAPCAICSKAALTSSQSAAPASFSVLWYSSDKSSRTFINVPNVSTSVFSFFKTMDMDSWLSSMAETSVQRETKVAKPCSRHCHLRNRALLPSEDLSFKIALTYVGRDFYHFFVHNRLYGCCQIVNLCGKCFSVIFLVDVNSQFMFVFLDDGHPLLRSRLDEILDKPS